MDPRIGGAGLGMTALEAASFGIQKKKDPRSPLMQAKAAAAGEKVNACPFGCELEDLDDNGYCRHLVGFTEDGKNYEPMVRRNGRRVVQVKRSAMVEGTVDEDGYQETVYGPPILEPLKRGDKLVAITTSSRVYRDVDKAQSDK